MFFIVCQEFFNKENDNLTVKEIREKIGKNVKVEE